MLNKRFIHKVECYIADNTLLNKKSKHVVALSGGADSVALALCLKQLGYTIEAAHCNFHLRGAESDRDENFCIDFCKKNDILLHITHFDTEEFASLRKISIEMAARQLRYNYFNHIMGDIGAETVCVAHHQDDSVETLLMNLIRGTGIHGLRGIMPKNGNIIRPLLCVTRNEIEHALKEAGQTYVTDSTNLIDDVVRNKIRLDIIPLMKTINPSVSDSIAQTAARITEASAVLDIIMSEKEQDIIGKEDNGITTIDIAKLSACCSPKTMLFNILRRYSFNSAQTVQIARAIKTVQPGRVFSSPTHRLLVDREKLFIEPIGFVKHKRMLIPENGTYVYDETTKFKVEHVIERPNVKTLRSNKCCHIDASKVVFPLTIRHIEEGDRFIPFGMKGAKLISDFLTDLKLNLSAKQRQLIIVDALGHTLWVVGLRSDDRCKITDNTDEIVKITMVDA